MIDSFEELFDGTYDKLKQINDNYNWVVLQIYNSQRQYSTGKLDGEEKTIFGKSQDYQKNLEQVFTDLLSDIDNETLGLFNSTKVIFEKEEETVFKNVFKTQLKNLVENKKATFFDELDRHPIEYRFIDHKTSISLVSTGRNSTNIKALLNTILFH